MSTRTKFILTYVAGIITGVVIVFAISFYTVMNFSEGETKKIKLCNFLTAPNKK